jgi:hypothetical protein
MYWHTWWFASYARGSGHMHSPCQRYKRRLVTMVHKRNMRSRKQTLELVSVQIAIYATQCKTQIPMISVHLHHRTIPSPPNDPLFYTWYFCPWKGLQIPLTLSFKLLTFLVSLLSFSPLALRSSVAFSRISLGSMLRTQMAFSFPQMYLPFMTG